MAGKGKKKVKVSPAVKKYVKSAISRDIETKYITQDGVAVNPIPYTGTMALVSYSPAITQGTGVSNRLGDKIKLKDLEIRLHFATPATYNSYVRCLLVQYKQQDGRDLVVNDFMSNTAGYGPDRVLHPDFILHEKVRILYDRIVEIGATGNVTADENHKILVIKKKLNFFQSFLRNGSTGTYADIATNGVYLVMFGSHDLTSTARAALRDIQWRLTYEDA